MVGVSDSVLHRIIGSRLGVYLIAMITRHCATCNTAVSRPYPSDFRDTKSGDIYCSHSCAGKAHHGQLTPLPAKTRSCYRCGKSFKAEKGHKSRKACPACYMIRETLSLLTIGQVEATNNSTERRDRYGRIRLHCRSVHAELCSQPCAACSYDKHVELCHIRGISEWPKDTLVGVVNARENVVQLCPNHHWELDHGALSLAKAPSAGLGPATLPVETACSIQLSYEGKDGAA